MMQLLVNNKGYIYMVAMVLGSFLEHCYAVSRVVWMVPGHLYVITRVLQVVARALLCGC